MNKLIATLLLGTVALSTTPVFATTQDDAADVASDANAIRKDKAAQAKDSSDLAKDRADKANAKASGDTMKQAGSSLAIGADHAIGGEKKAETSADKKILTHHENQLNNDVSK